MANTIEIAEVSSLGVWTIAILIISINSSASNICTIIGIAVSLLGFKMK